jgi:hypothetical protein
MKTKLIFIALVVLALFTSCKKDETKKEENPKYTDEPVNFDSLTYSDKNVAENKTYIENNGVQMVEQMKSLNKEQGLKATINLLDIASNSGGSLKGAQISSVFRTLEAIKNLGSGNPNVRTLVSALKAGGDNSISSMFKQIAGEYKYNFTTNRFDFTADPEASVTVLFPASKESKQSKTNDGVLEIFKPVFQTGSFDFGGAVITELPTSIKYEVRVSSSVVASYNFTASYNNDGLPTSIISALTLGTFEFKVTWGYSSTELSVNFSFKHGDVIMVDMGAGAGGNFVKDSINGMGDYPEKVLHNANAHFQLMGVKIAGQINFKGLITTMREMENGSDSATVDAINKYVNLAVVYATDNKAIATAEAYIKDEVREEYNYETNQMGQKTVKVIDFRMVFADKTNSSLDVYFNQGFDDLTAEFNTFIDELNTTYGWDMKHVD